MKVKRDKKEIVIVFLLVALVFMTVGYALLSAQLNVEGTATIVGNFEVKFSDISPTYVGGALEKEGFPKIIDNTTATFDVEFNAPNDSATYVMTVKNTGTIPAKFTSFTGLENFDGDDPIIYTVVEGSNNLEINDVLEPNETKTFTVKVTYDDVTELPDEEDLTKSITVNLNFIQHVES